jgi:hypothetical protein
MPASRFPYCFPPRLDFGDLLLFFEVVSSHYDSSQSKIELMISSGNSVDTDPLLLVLLITSRPQRLERHLAGIRLVVADDHGKSAPGRIRLLHLGLEVAATTVVKITAKPAERNCSACPQGKASCLLA